MKLNFNVDVQEEVSVYRVKKICLNNMISANIKLYNIYIYIYTWIYMDIYMDIYTVRVCIRAVNGKLIGKPSRCARHAGRKGGPKHVVQLSQVRTPECSMSCNTEEKPGEKWIIVEPYCTFLTDDSWCFTMTDDSWWLMIHDDWWFMMTNDGDEDHWWCFFFKITIIIIIGR